MTPTQITNMPHAYAITPEMHAAAIAAERATSELEAENKRLLAIVRKENREKGDSFNEWWKRYRLALRSQSGGEIDTATARRIWDAAYELHEAENQRLREALGIMWHLWDWACRLHDVDGDALSKPESDALGLAKEAWVACLAAPARSAAMDGVCTN